MAWRQISEMKEKILDIRVQMDILDGVYDKNKKYPLYNSEHHLKKLKKSTGGQDILKKFISSCLGL